MKHITLKQVGNQRGQALIVMAIAFLAFAAMGALAIDFGNLTHTINELQVVSDIAASTALRTLLNGTAGDTGTAQTNAETIAGLNDIRVPPPVWARKVEAGDLQITSGNYNGPGSFAAGAPYNAVQVTTTTTVHNLLGAGSIIPSSTDRPYSRTATARLMPTASSTPHSWVDNASVAGTLPLALDGCAFAFNTSNQPIDCRLPNAGGNLPASITLTNLTGNSTWIDLNLTGVTSPDLLDYLPTACGGSGPAMTQLTTGTDIAAYTTNVTGQQASGTGALLTALTTCPNVPGSVGASPPDNAPLFIVPVLSCTNPTQVAGFATLFVDLALNAQVVCNTRELKTAAPGDATTNFGTGFVQLVQNQ